MKKWAEDYPENVSIVLDNAGGTQIKLPAEWFLINPPKKPRAKRTKK